MDLRVIAEEEMGIACFDLLRARSRPLAECTTSAATMTVGSTRGFW
jgi:hypothetical protein